MTRIDVDAARVISHPSKYMTGACIEDVNHEVYGGIYTQMLFGESFQAPASLPVGRRRPQARRPAPLDTAASRTHAE